MEHILPFVGQFKKSSPPQMISMDMAFNIRKIRFILLDLLSGTTILKILKRLHEDQYQSAHTLDAERRRKLEQLFISAKSHTKFYRAYNNYEELPVLNKDVIREQPDAFVYLGFPKKLFSKATGGSTGMPLVYLTTLETRSYMWAGIILSWQSAGYQLGDSVAFLAGTSLSKSDYKHKLFYRLMNIHVFSAFQLDEKSLEAHIKGIQKSKATIIYGYASALDTMASYIKSTGQCSFPHLKSVITTAEVLTPAMRQNIREAFNLEVYNQYGCNEAGVSAFECEHHSMHLISSRCFYETDALGHLISTDLSNKGYLMLKYNTGDFIELSKESNCSCGRKYPIIKHIIGRSFDVVKDMNQHLVHSAFFNILFRNDSSIRQYQIRYTKNSIQVYLRTDDQSIIASHYQSYMDTIQSHLSFEHYDLFLNTPFLQSANAKHRHIIHVE